jgi:hypothetical protein
MDKVNNPNIISTALLVNKKIAKKFKKQPTNGV